MRIKHGDVTITRMREILPTRYDFFLVELSCFALGALYIKPMLFGKNKISIKLWNGEEGNGKPTIVSETGLRWKTFDMDDNILTMIKHRGDPAFPDITILITKRYPD
jgi:hypothetical protein